MIWSIHEKAENEVISEDGFKYPKIPSPREISELRCIKVKRRKERLLEVKKPDHPLANELIGIANSREENRKELTERLSNNLISLFKGRGMLKITSDDINDLLEHIHNPKRRSELRRNIMSILVKNKQIEESSFNKTFYTYERKPLISLDGDSFQAVKNKKSVICGSNVSIARIPHKVKVRVYNIL